MRLKYCLAVALALVASVAGRALELADFVLSQSRARGIPAMQPARDGNYYYQLSADGSQIRRIAYRNALDETTVLNGPELAGAGDVLWDGYRMSADERKILLWTNSRPIYRHSISADYYVYDRSRERLTKLTDEGGEEIATLSPDGNRVAYVKSNNIYMLDLRDGSRRAVTTDGKKNEVINGVPDWVYQEEFGILNSLTWSSDGSRLSFLRFDESQVPMYSMTLYQGDCRPDSARALYPGSYDYKYPVAGQRNSVVTVVTCDVATGTLATEPLPITANDYVPHLAYAPAGGPLMVTTLNRTQNDLHIYAVVPGQTPRAVYHETSNTWVDSELANRVTYYDGFLVIPSMKSGRTQLYRVDLATGRETQLTHADEDVTAYYGYDAKRQRYYYQSTAGPLNRQVKWTDASGREQALTGADGTYGARFSSSFDYYVRTYSSATVPPQYAIFKTSGKRVRDLETNSDYAEKYASRQVPRVEFFTMQSDGVTLNGYLIKPVDFDPSKKYPVIMQQYSGPGSQQVLNSWSLDWQQYFAMQGFVIACVDGRGTGGRGKAFQDVVYQRLGHYESIDQVAAARHMASLPWVDKDHIGIWGWSYGGYEALMAMSTPGAPYACGVAIAPVTTWRFYDTIYAERYMRTPQENAKGYDEGAPLNHVADLKGDVLIMFGSADDNVHIINEMEYIAKLHGQNRQFDMMVFPNMNHSINGCGVRLPLYQHVFDYFTRKLKGN